MTKDEALKALIHEMEYVLSCINKGKIPFDGDDFHEALRLGKKALAQPEQTNIERHEASVQKFLGASQPEQEPVAWIHTKIKDVAVPHRPADLDKYPDRWEALYKVPPPCPTCEALARSVMMDQTGRGA